MNSYWDNKEPTYVAGFHLDWQIQLNLQQGGGREKRTK